MNRLDFIKTLGLASSGLILPTNLLGKSLVKIYDNYIRGVQYYSYSSVKELLKEGDRLSLKHESENIYDSFAVAVYYEECKLGYLPAYENIVLANMLDAKVELTALVSKLQPNSSYQPIALEVFAELVTPTPQLLTALQNNRASDAEDIYRQGGGGILNFEF